MRNRFERSEEKARRRTASGKTIAIPASEEADLVIVIVIVIFSGKTIAFPALDKTDPGTEGKLIRSHLPWQRTFHNPDQFPRLVRGRCPNPTQSFSCSRRRCCSTLTAASFHDSGKSFIGKVGL